MYYPVVLFFIVRSISAWSSECHSIVAYIAGSLLDSDETRYLKTLMDWPADSNVAKQLADVSMEPDSSAPMWERFKRYHYGHCLPTFETPWNMTTMCGSSTHKTECVVTGVGIWTSKAASVSQSRENRQFAIKMVTHLMADLHQPLHMGLEGDLGGLLIKRVWPSYDPFGINTHYDLHELWDKGLFRHFEVEGIRSGLIVTKKPQPQYLFSDGAFTPQTPQAIPDPGWMYLAKQLMGSLNESTIASYKIPDPDQNNRNISRSGQAMRLPKKIVAETIRAVRDFAYKDETGKWLQHNRLVSREYMNSRLEIMKTILAKAGVRLAYLLKHIIRYSNTTEDSVL